jgi:hypothetical protein
VDDGVTGTGRQGWCRAARQPCGVMVMVSRLVSLAF